MDQSVTIQLPGLILAVRVIGESPASGASQAPVSAEGVQELARQTMATQQAQLAQTCAALQRGAEELANLHSEILKEAEQQLVELAIDIARKILMQEIQAERYSIDPIVAEALAGLPTRQNIAVHLHPDDLARCELARDGAKGSGRVTFVADASVQPAECVLETPQGIVNSTIEAHLQDVAVGLKDEE